MTDEIREVGRCLILHGGLIASIDRNIKIIYSYGIGHDERLKEEYPGYKVTSAIDTRHEK